MTIDMEDVKSLADQTMFLVLSFQTFGNSRKADVEAKVPEGEIEQSRFNHTKKLLDSPELKNIGKADIAIKNLIQVFCLPSKFDSSIRCVPYANATKVWKLLKEYRDVTRPELVEVFLNVYEAQRAESQKALGPQYNPNHFPSKEAMRAKFNFAFRTFTFGVPDALQTYDPQAYAEAQQLAHEHMIDATKEVADAMRLTASALVSKLADVLAPTAVDGKPKKIFDAHIDNLKEFINAFDIKNIANDAALKQDMDKLHLLLDGVDADKIRHSDNLKTDLAGKVAEIAKSVATLAEVKGRKFRD